MGQVEERRVGSGSLRPALGACQVSSASASEADCEAFALGGQQSSDSRPEKVTVFSAKLRRSSNQAAPVCFRFGGDRDLWPPLSHVPLLGTTFPPERDWITTPAGRVASRRKLIRISYRKA